MKRFLVCLALIVLMPGLWKSRPVDAASEKKPQQATLTQRPAASNPADFVGSDTCETCHAEVAKKFSTNPHSRLALMHDGKGATCESCHGPGKAHVTAVAT